MLEKWVSEPSPPPPACQDPESAPCVLLCVRLLGLFLFLNLLVKHWLAFPEARLEKLTNDKILDPRLCVFGLFLFLALPFRLTFKNCAKFLNAEK